MDSLLGIVKSLVGALLMPLPVFLGLTLLGLALLAAGRRRLGWSLTLVALLSLALAAWRPVADGLLGPLENRYPALTDPLSLVPAGAPPSVAAIVVLGGGWWPNDQWPSGSQLAESSALRLLEGVRLARALPDVPLLLTGADRQGEIPPVAWGYAQAARDRGIAPARPRLVLVTSAAHMPRALLHFQAVGLDPIPAPTQHLAGRATGRRLSDWLPSASKICARPSPPCMNTWACWPGAGIIRGRGRTGSTQLTRRLDLPRAPRA